MSAQRPWTGEQRRAIERRDGDLLLDAGAGSGKTSVLVERFVASVLKDGIDPTSILTITFTEKAAAELRDRIRRRLRDLGADEAARATEGAFISTIHGFCARILRAHALAAGLDPEFSVLDRPQSEPLAAAAFDAALPQLASESSDGVELLAAYGVGSLRGSILSTYAALRSGGESVPRLPPVPTASLDEARRALELAAGGLAAELASIASPGPQVLRALERVERARELAAVEDLWPTELEWVRLPGGNGAALATDACVAYREALSGFRAQVGAVAAAPIRDLLDRLLRTFGERYAEYKRRVSGVDFEDLELLSRDLLRADSELRERYAARFARIMVDEFQDTNRVQLELIESIARGNLFTVGDAQQSIYGFRHADVELFEQRGQALETVGARMTLRTNFRSRPEILDVLSLAFATELGDRFKALEPGRPRGAENEVEDGGGVVAGEGLEAEPRVELRLVDKGADWELEGVASPWRLAEARALAQRVAELVAAGAAPGDIVVLIRATTDMRAYERALERRGLPTYVIGGRGYWAHPQIVDMVAYLRALANPRDEEALYSVLASPLVGISLDALVVIGAAARACGRDPWWLLRDPGDAGEAADPLQSLGDEDRRRLTRFQSWFAAERAGAPSRGIEELIDGALRRTGYDLAMLAMPGGRRRLANVRKLMRLGREYEAEHGADLRGFVEAIAERVAGRAGDSRESEAPVEGDGLDAVRLMTIHRAKGLEFEIVCVADLGRSVRPASPIVRVSRDGRIGLRLARAGVGGRESALAYKELGDEQRQAEEREERRLFYVAMTRARQRLILSGAAKLDGWTVGGATGGGPVAWIAPALFEQLGALIAEGGGVVTRDGASLALRLVGPDDPSLEPESRIAPGQSTSPSSAGPPLGAAPAPLPAPAPAVGTPVSSLSYSSLGEYARCGYRFYAERVLGLPPVAETAAGGAAVAEGGAVAGSEAAAGGGATPPAPGLAADARGILVHALLEGLDFRRPLVPSAPAIVAAAQRAGITPAPSPEDTVEVGALIEAFAAGELRARLARARDLRREERFAFVLGGGLLMTGAIDVLAQEPEGRMLVVDYKSDRLRGEAPAAIVRRSYATQRLIYALAALRAGATAVEVIHCFLERPDEPVTATFAGSDLERLEGELGGL
ncbi:MAG TPA: UvrD-helicase domain-containing protein, partial [Solirubrobacteraceae bacterium]